MYASLKTHFFIRPKEAKLIEFISFGFEYHPNEIFDGKVNNSIFCAYAWPGLSFSTTLQRKSLTIYFDISTTPWCLQCTVLNMYALKSLRKYFEIILLQTLKSDLIFQYIYNPPIFKASSSTFCYTQMRAKAGYLNIDIPN